MTTDFISDRVNAAAIKFLERRGYEIIDPSWSIAEGQNGIIANDEGTLVFVDTAANQSTSGMPDEDNSEESRRVFEDAAAKWLADPEAVDYADTPVRFDAIRMLVIGADRALLRHHIGRFGVATC